MSKRWFIDTSKKWHGQETCLSHFIGVPLPVPSLFCFVVHVYNERCLRKDKISLCRVNKESKTKMTSKGPQTTTSSDKNKPMLCHFSCISKFYPFAIFFQILSKTFEEFTKSFFKSLHRKHFFFIGKDF